MSRFKVLRANPRRTLAALATLLIAVGVTAASGANFSSQKANAGNIMAAGSIDVGNSPGTAILTASNLKPGDSVTPGEVTIQNTGTLSGTFKLTASNLSDNGTGKALAPYLDVLVQECTTASSCASVVAGPAIYNGTLAAMTNYTLGSPWAAGAQHRYKFSATLNTSTPNSLQGGAAKVDFVWDATA